MSLFLIMFAAVLLGQVSAYIVAGIINSIVHRYTTKRQTKELTDTLVGKLKEYETMVERYSDPTTITPTNTDPEKKH